MASKTQWFHNRAIKILFSFFVHLKWADAYYCDNDRCNEDEYCCGDNTCCPSYKVWDLWYLWCGVLFFMFLLSLCTCLWRYRFLSRGTVFLTGYTYTPLQEIDTVDARADMTSVSRYERSHYKPFTPPLGSPPPYNQVASNMAKSTAPPPSYAKVIGLRDPH